LDGARARLEAGSPPRIRQWVAGYEGERVYGEWLMPVDGPTAVGGLLGEQLNDIKKEGGWPDDLRGPAASR
jgi:hypothetical protein